MPLQASKGEGRGLPAFALQRSSTEQPVCSVASVMEIVTLTWTAACPTAPPRTPRTDAWKRSTAANDTLANVLGKMRCPVIKMRDWPQAPLYVR